MSIVRRDDTCQNTLPSVAGVRVFYLGPQPVDTNTLTPLLPVYSDTSGTPTTNPQISDGTGHAAAYLNNGSLFTCVYVYPNGAKVIYPDQFVGASSGAPIPFAGVPTGTVDGTNRVFTVVNGSTPLTAIPTQLFATFNGSFLTIGLGYTLAVVGGQLKITYAAAPQPASGSIPADSFFVQGLL